MHSILENKPEHQQMLADKAEATDRRDKSLADSQVRINAYHAASAEAFAEGRKPIPPPTDVLSPMDVENGYRARLSAIDRVYDA